MPLVLRLEGLLCSVMVGWGNGERDKFELGPIGDWIPYQGVGRVRCLLLLRNTGWGNQWYPCGTALR